MFCKAYSAVVAGIDAVTVQVETDVRNGLPAWYLVGTLASEAKEARERVRVAVENAGFRLPPKRITINLSPADLRKEGTSFDLAIAVSLLTAFGHLPTECLEHCLFTGEVSLDGKLNRVPGVLPMACRAAKEGFQTMLVPKGNEDEAEAVAGIRVYGMETLQEVVSFLKEGCLTAPRLKTEAKEPLQHRQTPCGDLSEILGQETAKRAMTIAAAGGHHLLFVGPPGSGKTALASRMVSILPKLEFEEQLEVSKIHSVSGMLEAGQGLVRHRPFFAPHHTTTATALAGGGRFSKPGIISRSHCGVMFLDELPEFKREALETLREPLEDHRITVARLHGTYCYPASFQLVAAMNPCPCGNYPDREKCHCTPAQIRGYLGKLSRPILDRIDMMVTVLPVEYHFLREHRKTEDSETIRLRVEKARRQQSLRFSGTGTRLNSEMTKQEIETFCCLGREEEALLEQLFTRQEFSTRGYYRILKLARTIADLEEKTQIGTTHLMEAAQYRNTDRFFYGQTGGMS